MNRAAVEETLLELALRALLVFLRWLEDLVMPQVPSLAATW